MNHPAIRISAFTLAAVGFAGCHQFEACPSTGCGSGEPTSSVDDRHADASPAGDAATADDLSREASLDASHLDSFDSPRAPVTADASYHDATLDDALTEAGDVGTAISCEAHRGDCDESTLTGCETDLDVDVNHCGRCGTRCDGVCVAGACHPFETLMRNVSGPLHDGIAIGELAIYALSTSPAEVVQRGTQTATSSVLLASDRPFTGITWALTSGRLYLFGDGLFSISYRGDDLRDEKRNVDAAVACGDWLYFIDRADDRPYRSNLDSQVLEPLSIGPAGTPLYDVRLACGPGGQTLVARDGAGWEVYAATLAESSLWRPVAHVDEQPREVRMGSDAIFLSVETQFSPVRQELREIHSDGTSTILVAGSELVDFALSGSRVYASWYDPTKSGQGASLQVVSIANPELPLTLPVHYQLQSMVIVGDNLYVSEQSLNRVSRLPLWLP